MAVLGLWSAGLVAGMQEQTCRHLEIRTPASSRFLRVFSPWRRGRGTNWLEAVGEESKWGTNWGRRATKWSRSGVRGKRRSKVICFINSSLAGFKCDVFEEKGVERPVFAPPSVFASNRSKSQEKQENERLRICGSKSVGATSY